MSRAINSAPAPAVKGEPEICDRLPEELTEKADTLPDPELLTNAKLEAWLGVPIIELVLLIMPHAWRIRRMNAESKKTKMEKRCGARRKRDAALP